jgi:hypothetical protein
LKAKRNNIWFIPCVRSKERFSQSSFFLLTGMIGFWYMLCSPG